jgi:hypothetical protein
LVQDFVAEDHLARFVLRLVRDEINLVEVTGCYGSERGQPPFDPIMMTTLLLYSYFFTKPAISHKCRIRANSALNAFDIGAIERDMPELRLQFGLGLANPLGAPILVGDPIRHLLAGLVGAVQLVLLGIGRRSRRKPIGDLGFQFGGALLHALIAHRRPGEGRG